MLFFDYRRRDHRERCCSSRVWPTNRQILIAGTARGWRKGIIFRAEDLALRRTVALKFLPPDLTSDPARRDQLLREARAASQLDHINVGTIYGIEEIDDEQIFIVMACYEGETLKSLIRRGPIPAAEVEDIVVQVAEGLREAHSKGLIHRDIKPSNLILTRQGVIKIIDFGLAKVAETDAQTVKRRDYRHCSVHVA